MGFNTWARSRRTISFVRGQTESLRHIYLAGSNGAITSEPQDAINPPVLPPLGNIYPNSPDIIRALDEVLSELRTLETKYMLERHPSEAALDIPFLLRLRFRIKGKRDLEGILEELERRNEGLKAMTKELRKKARWNLESAHQISQAELSPSRDRTAPSQVEQGFSIPCMENSNPDTPPTASTLPPAGTTSPPAGTALPPAGTTLPPAHASMPPRAGDTNAVGNPPPPPSPHATPSFAGSEYTTNMSGEFHSIDSFSSYEREDNYSTHTGDKICSQCHQVWRRDSNS